MTKDVLADTSALILAAGNSSRMGCTKQLLDLCGAPLLERVIQTVATHPFCDIYIIIGHDAKLVQRQITLVDERCSWMINQDYIKGQGHSLKEGVSAIRTANAMVFLGDQPFIDNGTVANILEKGRQCIAKQAYPFVIRPIYNLQPGHPVYFGDLNQIDFSVIFGDRGANALMKQMEYYLEVPVEDDGCIIDIDTPMAYKKAKYLWELKHKTSRC